MSEIETGVEARPSDSVPSSEQPTVTARRAPVTRLELVALLGITSLAALLRFWKLGSLPPGIHVDEAFNILDAREVLAGWRPVFLPANAGRDVLYTYLQAPLLAAFGESIASARAASALVGTISIPLFWATTRRLLAADPRLDEAGLRRVALQTAALSAFAYWHLHFSRFGIRAILFPALVCGLAWAWWRLTEAITRSETPASERLTEASTAGQSRFGAFMARLRRRDMLLVAFCLGLAFYTHPAGRGLVALPAAHAAWLWWRHRDRRPLEALAAAYTGALLLAAPLLAFWWQHPQTFTSHAEETSIISQGPAALAANLAKVAGMFFLAGDPAPWRNLPGRPALGQLWPIDPGQLPLTILLGASFLLGLAHLLRAMRAGQSWAALLLLWLLALLVPTAVTDAAPNFSRAIGVLPLPFLLSALGFERIQARLALARPALATGWRPASLTLALAVLTLAATTGDYFARFANAPESPLAFDDDKVALGRLVKAQRDAGEAVYLSPAMAAHPTVRFVAGDPLSGLDLREGLVLPPLEVAGAVYPRLPGIDDLDPGPVLSLYASFLGLREARQLQRGLLPRGAEHEIELLIVEPLPGEKDWRRFGPALADFDGQIQLLGYDCAECPPAAELERLASTGQPLSIDIYWRSLRPSETDLNGTLQLVTEAGEGIAQVDGPPLGGSYPTDSWKPGEIVITRHVLTIPEDAPAGPAVLRVGWYDWRDGRPLTDALGQSVVELGRYDIRR